MTRFGRTKEDVPGCLGSTPGKGLIVLFKWEGNQLVEDEAVICFNWFLMPIYNYSRVLVAEVEGRWCVSATESAISH